MDAPPKSSKGSVSFLEDKKRVQLYTLFGFCVTILHTAIGTFALGNGKAFVWLNILMLGACVYLYNRRLANVHYVPLALILFLSIPWGCVTALYNYSKNYIAVDFYAQSRTYANITAKENAGTTMDAGMIAFDESAYVDTSRSTGYMDGKTTWCIAPVVSSPEQLYINFWVVGQNCCNSKGAFHCDSSGNGMVKAGVVIFDLPTWFGDNTRSRYRMARDKAIAQHGFTKVTHDVQYLRWSDDMAAISSTFYETALLYYFGYALLFTGIASLTGLVALYKEKNELAEEGKENFIKTLRTSTAMDDDDLLPSEDPFLS